MRSHSQQHFTLVQCLTDKTKRAVLEIAQTPMNQFAGGRRSARAEIVHFHEQHTEAAAGGVAGKPRTVYAAADNGEIEVGHCLMIRFLPQNERLACRTQGGRVLTSCSGWSIHHDCKISPAQPYRSN